MVIHRTCARKLIALVAVSAAVTGCSASLPSSSHLATMTPTAVHEQPSRSTCDYSLETTALDRDGESAIQAPGIVGTPLDGPPGVPFEWDSKARDFVDPETREPVEVVDIPTHKLDGDGGIRPGTERADSNGRYNQVQVAQSAEVVSSLDAWPRALPHVLATWQQPEFYLAQDFATCFLLTWYLDNPAVFERTLETVSQYAEQAESLVAPHLHDAWTTAATDVSRANGTSTVALQSALNGDGVARAYADSGVRYTLVRLRISEVVSGDGDETLVFKFHVAARYPSVMIPDPDAPGELKPAAADGIVTIAVWVNDGVPSLVGLSE